MKLATWTNMPYLTFRIANWGIASPYLFEYAKPEYAVTKHYVTDKFCAYYTYISTFTIIFMCIFIILFMWGTHEYVRTKKLQVISV